MLRLGEGLLGETFALLRSCGDGREECVVYWTGSISEPGLVDEVLHPHHRAGRGGYRVDSVWLNRTFAGLADRKREIRVQVHSHPRDAFHSVTDDEFPIVQTPGFLSLVVPEFAVGPVTLDGTYLARLNASGTWSSLQPEIALEVADVI